MREQVDEAAATSGDGEASEVIGEMVGSDGEMSAPRGEAAAGSAANEGSSAMAAANSNGETDELIGKTAGSAVSEMGDAMATAVRTPRSRGSRGRKKFGCQRGFQRSERSEGE